MTDTTRLRLFSPADAFDSPITTWGSAGVLAMLVTAPLIFLLMSQMGRLDAKMRRELWLRWASWCVIAPALLVPLLLGGAWWIFLVMVLSLFCFREFSRVTGLFREPMVMVVGYLGIVATAAGALDHWYSAFIAATPLTISLMAAAAVLSDRPNGYVQRVALGSLGFLLCGTGLGHLAFLANDAQFRPILFLLILAVQGNDVFAFMCGKAFGKRKLCPNTSPGKTIGGALGALVITTALVVTMGHFIVTGGVAKWWPHLIAAGALLSIAGQMGDLVLSSIKRDIGIKDAGTILPGHGGLLDRFDSLLLASPLVFYFIAFFRGVGLDQATRVFTGG